MKCQYCGTENADDAKFCAACGKPVTGQKEATDETEVAAEAAETPETAEKPETNEKTQKKKNSGNRKTKLMMILICVAAVIIFLAGFMIMRARKTIDLDKYVSFESTGYEGSGDVYAQIDWQKVEKKYGSRLSFTKEFKEQYGIGADSVSPVDVLQSFISVEVESDSNLSNNDKVKYKWNINKEYSQYVKCRLKYKDGSYKVTGLEEVKSFDAFKDLDVKFNGTEPSGYVTWDYKGSGLTAADFQCEDYETLKNGDKIKIYLDKSKADEYSANFGKTPEKWEKEYTVKGLNYYITKSSELDDETLKEMQEQAEEEYHNHMDQHWGNYESLESLTYMGDYLLSSKEKNGNALYLVYHVKVRDAYSNGSESYDQVNDVYWFICYQDVLADGEGNLIVDISDYRTPKNKFTIRTDVKDQSMTDMLWKYYGYQTLDDLYKNVVTANESDYNHDDNVDASK